jgi:hypothetical protein
VARFDGSEVAPLSRKHGLNVIQSRGRVESVAKVYCVVSSWVRAASDAALRKLVSGWLAEAWPFERVAYAGVA